MGIDLRPDEHVTDLVDRTSRFVSDVVLPEEEAHLAALAERGDDIRRELQARAREAGVFGPHVPRDLGGHGLGMADRAPVFEAAGYSLLGPLAVNAAAPDEGNLHLLHAVADDGQRATYLRPLADGEVRSAFAMTEPAPGAGSDPSALSTRATRVSGGWRIDGRKWFITGADGAAFTIVMARTSGESGDRSGATMFLVDADNPGMRVTRHIDTLDRSMLGGHCEVVFDNCVVTDAAVLGAVDEGFSYAQVRLAPARLTHCMRWLGAARRAHDVALRRAQERELFGSRLGDLGMVQQLVADSEIDIAASRALTLQASWELDVGRSASQSSSIAKTFVAEAVGRIVDRAAQICGGLGVSTELPIARLIREVRGFRIYDGPSETHRWAIARRALRSAGTA